MALLTVDNLHTHFHTDDGVIRAVDGIDLTIGEGEIVGLVGESGSGKSVTALSIMRLIDHPGRIADGTITFKGKDLLAMDETDLRRIRGNDISIIFQDPMTAFNPTQTVGRQVHDVLRTHRDGPVNPIKRAVNLDHTKAYKAEVIDLFARVGIPNAATRYDDYPHEFSGGMLQRAMISMALICEPDLIIADEPTTALDVSIESQILAMVRDLVDEFNTSMIWISHDLSVISEICDKVVVMYAGKIMETGDMADILRDPKHPYTHGLFDSVPRYDQPDKEIYTIEGSIPNPYALPSGCRFADRCPEVHDTCLEAHPPMMDLEDRRVACYLYGNGEDA